jgi:hypothetical protein
MFDLLVSPLYVLAAFYACWICFVAMITAKKLHREKKMGPILWVFFAPLLLGIGILDVGLQLTVANLLGRPREFTLSARMRRYREKGGNKFQLFVANKMCGKLLNPIDEGHC